MNKTRKSSKAKRKNNFLSFSIKKKTKNSRSAFIYSVIGIIVFLICVITTLIIIGRTTVTKSFQVKVLVLTMFEGETQPWLQQEKLPLDFKVPGAYSDVHCNNDGLCVTTLGEAKANATASLTAILLNQQFSFQHSYFLSAGIAGTSPSTGTLGFAAWARWIVDWDQGSHLIPDTVPDASYGYLPNTSSTNAVYHLNEKLTNLAYQVTSHLTLQDNQEAINNRQNYPGQENKHPNVAICDTIAGDDFWAGKLLSDEAQYITSLLTKSQGTYCTTEQEDIAIATVLQRMGYLDQYLNLRTASNFDQPYDGQSISDLFSKFHARDIAVSNAYLVGSTMAHYLLTSNPSQ